ncbi:protein TIC 62, chloroplastic [Salvia miltiorrhiza]|uniref:protein TIC 62, chloroplastic n=1 Tax=Salvia miltiorrhiza TaxID=226208 RepID=UPI0025AD03ED|nr:protein TIC 62, chloroplastic [Salvia miltiorrhiza]
MNSIIKLDHKIYTLNFDGLFSVSETHTIHAMASASLTLSPPIDLPLSLKASTKTSQSLPLFPLRPLNPPSSPYKFNRKAAVAASLSREQVFESAATDTNQDSPRPPSSKLVLVVGGTGGVGQLVVASLLDRNVRARLLLRNPEKATTLFGEQDEEKLQVRQGDTRNPEDLDPSIFEGVTHVICCTGTTAFPSRRWDGDNTPERTDWEGVRNLVSALPSSLKRIVLVSSVGVTKFNELPWSIMNLFGVLKYKKMGEDFVRNSGLPYTIIRPGRLTDGPYTSYDLNTLLQATAGERRAVVIGQGDKLVGEVSRLVVAEACIQALDIDFTEGQIYEINSVQGEGPGSDPKKWQELFKGAKK